MSKAGLDRKVLGRNISRLRKAWGWTQTDLAKRAALSESQLSRLERGKSDMSVLTFFALCHALECTPNELLQDVE